MRERPDLSNLPDEVVAYIEALEQELAHLQSEEASSSRSEAPLEPSEPPTTVQVISISAARRGQAHGTPPVSAPAPRRYGRL